MKKPELRGHFFSPKAQEMLECEEKLWIIFNPRKESLEHFLRTNVASARNDDVAWFCVSAKHRKSRTDNSRPVDANSTTTEAGFDDAKTQKRAEKKFDSGVELVSESETSLQNETQGQPDHVNSMSSPITNQKRNVDASGWAETGSADCGQSKTNEEFDLCDIQEALSGEQLQTRTDSIQSDDQSEICTYAVGNSSALHDQPGTLSGPQSKLPLGSDGQAKFSAPSGRESDSQTEDSEGVDFLEEADRLFQELLQSGAKVTACKLIDIARRSGHTVGKWLVFRPPNAMNHVWRKVATATYNNELGASCKVNPRNKDSSSQVLCVFTDDFTDEADVWRVEQKLRGLGIEGKLAYKPDIYTTLGIYNDNPFRLKPSVYVSNDKSCEEK